MTSDDVNHCHFVGTVVAALEVRELPTKRCVANFKLKIGETITDPSGQRIAVTENVKLVAWDAAARQAADLKPGARISVQGRLHRDDWTTRQGPSHYCYEVILTEPITILDESTEPLPPLTPRYACS